MDGTNLTIDQLGGMIESLGGGESLVIYNLDNKIYRAADAISNSDMGLMKYGSAQIIWARNAPVDDDKLRTLDIGSAVHCKLLEPHKFDDEFVIEPVFNRRANDGKEAAAAFASDVAAAGKAIITNDDGKKIDFMARSALAHPTMNKLLSKGDSEVSIFWCDVNTGVMCKCRPDHLVKFGNQWFCLDLKTTDDIEKFDKSIGEYGYHRQQAFYTEGLTVAGMNPIFVFGVISKKVCCGRYPVRILSLDKEDVLAGENEFRGLLSVWAKSLRTGYYEGISGISRTVWARKADIKNNDYA